MDWTLRTDASGLGTRWCDELAAGYKTEGFWREETLVDVARRALAADQNAVLTIEGDRTLTRQEAWEQALRLAAYFRDKGLVPGDVVSFQLPNWNETPVISLASRMMGLIANPIPPIYRGSELAFILKDCRSRMIFVPRLFRKNDHTEMCEALLPDLPDLATIVTVRGEGTVTWDAALDRAPLDEADLPKINPASVMMVMYTSGTTGRPKGVLHSHYNFDYRVRSMGAAWSVGHEDVVFMPSPVTHITGAYWAFDMPWVTGARSVLLDVWSADTGIQAIERHGCTISGGATPFLQQLLDTGGARPEALATMRIFFCGGTTVSPDLIRAANAAFPNCMFFRAYGSTEMSTATLGIRDSADSDKGAKTDGEIVYPTECRILNPAGTDPVSSGEEGEILLRGPEGFVGYLRAEDNADNFEPDGFFRMGDLGMWVNDNYIVITGRKKDIIIRSGENISPKEVEDVLYRHPAIAEVAIVAMPSRLTGEKGCAFVMVRSGHTIDLPRITQFLDTSGLAKQKYPEFLVVVDDLPRVPSGKIKKDMLRVRARDIAESEETAS